MKPFERNNDIFFYSALNMPDGSDDKTVLDRLNMFSYDFDHKPFVRTAKDMLKKRECPFNESSLLK